jgi:hypothetical protein
MLKIREIRAALVDDRTACGELCARREAVRLMEDIDRMQDGDPPEMSEEEVTELRNPRIPPDCKEGCAWSEVMRDATFRHLDLLARWRYDRKRTQS